MTLALARGHQAAAFVSTLHVTAGWWNATRVLAVANVVLAAVGVGTIIFGVIAIRSSGTMAKAAGEQAQASATLAVATGKQADASDRIAVSADMQNLAGVRPLLVEVPKGLLGAAEIDQEGPGKILWGTASGGTVVLTVPLRNIGPGPAFVDRVTIGPAQHPIAEAEMTARAVAPGDTAFVVSLTPDGTSSHGAMTQALDIGLVTVEVTYADVNSTQRTLTRLTVAATLDKKTVLVKMVELYHCDQEWRPIEPPFARTRIPAGMEPRTAEPPANPPAAEPPADVPCHHSDEEIAAAIATAHAEGLSFGEAAARDVPPPWTGAVLARKPRMPSDVDARMLQVSRLPIDLLMHDEVRHALRGGFFDALERARPAGTAPGEPAAT